MRDIGDTSHPSIADADALFVWFHRQDTFKLMTKKNFIRPPCCQVCPIGYRKSDNQPLKCQYRIVDWNSFKRHLSRAETIIGELIAFPFSNKPKLPNKAIYKKYRFYGKLLDYTKKDNFYIFDINEKNFIHIHRNELLQRYSKNNKCTYCKSTSGKKCNLKIQSNSALIKHLQSLETRYFCYLIYDDLMYNDDENMKRIQKFLKFLNETSPNEFNRLLDEKNCNLHDLDLDDLDESINNYTNNQFYANSEERSNHDEDELNDDDSRSIILNKFENAISKSSNKINDYFNRLRNQLNSANLNQAIIDLQNSPSLELIKKNEDFKYKEKEFSFTKSVILKADQLDYLLRKYSVPDNYEIYESYVTIDILLKENNSLERPSFKSTSNDNSFTSSINKAKINIKEYSSSSYDEIYSEVDLEADDNQTEKLDNLNKISSLQFVKIKKEKTMDDDDGITNLNSIKRLKTN